MADKQPISTGPDHEGASAARPRRAAAGGDDRDDAEASAFYRHLEQAGQLADVTADTDLGALSPRITHVRWPDGRVARIGFSGS